MKSINFNPRHQSPLPLKVLMGLLPFLLMGSFAQAGSSSCDRILLFKVKGKVKVSVKGETLTSAPETNNVASAQTGELKTSNTTQEKILKLRTNSSHLNVSDEVLAVVFNNELRIYEKNLLTILEGGGFDESSLRAFYETLFFPEDLIKPRLEMSRALDENNILSVLGDLSLKETIRLFVGNSPISIEKDSLLGRYLAETNSKMQKNSFMANAKGIVSLAGSSKSGNPNRLIVPVDEKSFATFKKYFSTEQAYAVQGHGNVLFGGKLLMNAQNLASKEPRFMTVNTPLPFVLLKTTEAARMERYIKAVQKPNPPAENGGYAGPWDNPARSPWNWVKTADGKDYLSKKGSYNCCTHWHGNIPLGDKGVTEIILPGPNNKPITVTVSRPDYSSSKSTKYVEDVWTYPMHEPISAILGLAQENGQGNFASPGWVVGSLLTVAPQDRIPMVFIFTQDASLDIDPKVALNIEDPW
jgi:hypothetical protein